MFDSCFVSNSALDLQHCGLSDDGANGLREVLQFNRCIVILDIRNNPMIGQCSPHPSPTSRYHNTSTSSPHTGDQLIDVINEHLRINANGQQCDVSMVFCVKLYSYCTAYFAHVATTASACASCMHDRRMSLIS